MSMYTEHLIREIQTNYSENLRSIEKMLLDLAAKTMDYHCIDVNLEGDCCIRIEINKSKKPLITPKENSEFTKEDIENWIKMKRNNKNPLRISQKPPFDCNHNCQFCTIDFCQERTEVKI